MAVGLTYATSHTLVRMRLAAFRHALKDQNRLTWIVGGGFVGLVLAGGTVWVAAPRQRHPGRRARGVDAGLDHRADVRGRW